MRWAACCIKKGERTMSKITIQNAKKQYGDTTVIEGLNLEIRDGELFTLLGPSGCGKTTLLRMIAGFNSIEGGDFYFNEERINDKEPSKRNIGMVFQNYAIFPHMTVAKNVAYGLKNRKTPKDEIARETDRFLEIMQIKQYADRLPEKKSSAVVVLHTSRSKWVWASMKPGSSSCPSTSMTVASGAEMLRATRRIFSSSTSTSARRVPRPDTTVPPRNRYFMENALLFQVDCMILYYIMKCAKIHPIFTFFRKLCYRDS